MNEDEFFIDDGWDDLSEEEKDQLAKEVWEALSQEAQEEIVQDVQAQRAWEALYREEQEQIIQDNLDELIASGLVVELLPVNGERTYAITEGWQRKLESN